MKIEIERQPDGVLIAVRTHSRARACWGLAAIPFAILGAIAIDEAAASVALVGATITAALGVLVWTWPRLNVIHASSRGVVWTAYFWGVARRTELGHESVSPVVVSECDVLWRGSIHDVHTFLVFGKAERAFRINAPANRATELAALIEGAVGA
ncbi:MAG: hypothetical protein IPK60_23850 [Sandaracinaceae bacterium]|nr:hypothetical protein [Sandaracinaceae bacterium]